MSLLSVDAARGLRVRVWVLAAVGCVVFAIMTVVDGMGGGDFLWFASAATLVFAGCAIGYACPATWPMGGAAIVWAVQCGLTVGRVVPAVASPGRSTGGVAGLLIIVVVMAAMAPLFALGVGLGERWSARARAVVERDQV